MSYLNNNTGYRETLLSTRSVYKKGKYTILEPDGIVKNVIPGYENCDTTILGSPAMGASLLIIFQQFIQAERTIRLEEMESNLSYM